MTFADLNLNKFLLNALNDQGLTTPTPIQEQAFPVIMSGKDVVGIAQTGTGKTLAFMLPILRLMKFSKVGDPRILVVVPTRELVLQMLEEVEKLTEYMTLRTVGIYGGTNINTQKKAVMDGVDIVVATPGRLVDIVLTRALRLKQVKHFVIDEVDEMLNLGFRTQLTNILDLLPKKRQSLLFSATITDEVEKIIDDFFNAPVKIEIAATGTPLENIHQRGFEVPNFYTKANLLKYLLETDETLSKVLVFVRSKTLTDLLFEILDENIPGQSTVIHSNKSQNYRINSVQGFEAGEFRILLATDLISRGLDFTAVSHVINFDIPEVPEDYMHRIGRTGRAEKEGQSISFISEQEQGFREAIENLMNTTIPLETLPEAIEVSTELIEAEKLPDGQKNYLPEASIKHSKGAFHEKKDKNKKTNLGGSYRRELKAKYKKPIKRSAKKKK